MATPSPVYIKRAIIAIEEAAEFGDRFPDLPPYEVLQFIDDVCGWTYDENTPMGRAVYAAYNFNTAEGYRTFAAYSGVDIAPTTLGTLDF